MPTIAITPGEPAGIGPELAIMLAQEKLDCELIAIADPQLLQRTAQGLGIDTKLVEANGSEHKAGTLHYIPVPLQANVVPGRLNTCNAPYVLKTLDIATQGCLSNQFDAMVTGPVQKSIINEAGIPFSGHTEYLAAHCGTDLPVMMLASRDLRVTLYSTHIPLSAVSDYIDRDRIIKIVSIIANDLETRFGISNPVISVCGLNPHAGENGHIGREEIESIIPALDILRAQGINVIGPLPADTAFTPAALEKTDTVLAMYHDQGLPVIKHSSFGEVVNITLGLPIIRTSVDHGTALDLAGTGKANVDSLREAVSCALELCRHQAKRS